MKDPTAKIACVEARFLDLRVKSWLIGSCDGLRTKCEVCGRRDEAAARERCTPIATQRRITENGKSRSAGYRQNEIEDEAPGWSTLDLECVCRSCCLHGLQK